MELLTALQLGHHQERAPNMKTLLALTLALVAASGFAQTNSVTNAFTVTPTRKMQPFDRAAYVRAGGASNATDAAVYTWQHYGIKTNGSYIVPVSVVHSTVTNDLWNWAQWLRTLCYTAGMKTPFQGDAFMVTLTDWANNYPTNANAILFSSTQATEKWATMLNQGYDLNKLPPVTLPVTNWIYGPINAH